MNRNIVSTVCILVCITAVKAQEFWLQPDKFIFRPGENLMLNFNAGENFMGRTWNIGRQAITRLERHQLGSKVNLSVLVGDGDKTPVSVPLKEEGTHLILMESNNSFLERDSDSFAEFLKSEGQDEALAMREKSNTTTNPGKEFYSCHTKLLVQVGNKMDDTFRKADGFPIEIIPERNPYTLKKGDPLRFTILYQGKPMFGARVKVWNRFDNRTTLQNIYTEKNGVIETRISNPGPWMVTIVKVVPSKQAGAEWQSYRVSLVFGIEY